MLGKHDFKRPALPTVPEVLDYLNIEYDLSRCKCPIHKGDNYTSFSFIDEGWHCFSCGKSGNVIDLIMQVKKISYKDAKQICEELSSGRIRRVDSKSRLLKLLDDEEKRMLSYIVDQVKQGNMSLRQAETRISTFQIEKCRKKYKMLNAS